MLRCFLYRLDLRMPASNASKRKKDAVDAFRILVAVVFILLAAMASVDKETIVEVLDSSSEVAHNPPPSWASLLLEALQRIV